MRLALLVAFVGSLVFVPAAVDARPSKTTVASKQKAKKKAKPVKASRTTKKKVVEEDAPTIEEETKSVAKQEAPARRTGASVAQATDDEVPRNEPGKRR